MILFILEVLFGLKTTDNNPMQSPPLSLNYFFQADNVLLIRWQIWIRHNNIDSSDDTNEYSLRKDGAYFYH